MSEGLPKRPEQRHHKRVDSVLAVELEVDGKKLTATTGNISCGGMFLPQLDQDLSENQPITALISLPEQDKIVKMSGTVCRVQRPVDQAPGVAVQFSGLYDDNHHQIDRYIKWKLPN